MGHISNSQCKCWYQGILCDGLFSLGLIWRQQKSRRKVENSLVVQIAHAQVPSVLVHFLSGRSALGQKVGVFDFERPNLTMDSGNPTKHPPKWLVRHLFHAFIIFGQVFGQFWKIAFLAPFWRHFPLIKGQKMDLAGWEPKNDRGV